ARQRRALGRGKSLYHAPNARRWRAVKRAGLLPRERLAGTDRQFYQPPLSTFESPPVAVHRSAEHWAGRLARATRRGPPAAARARRVREARPGRKRSPASPADRNTGTAAC